jgi:O-antigen/teichoic acid export membrane protein
MKAIGRQRNGIIMPRSNKKQFAMNAASGWLAQLSLVVTGIILIPYAISRMGKQEYGFFQLGQSALAVLMFLQLGMAPTLVRFCSQAIAARDKDEIAKISSTAQLFLGGLGLAGMLIALALIPVFISFYKVPDFLVAETRGLLICMAISLLLNFLFIVPNGLVFGANRHDSANILDVVCNCLRLGLIIAVFELIRPSLLLFGLAILAMQLIRLLGIFYLAVKYAGRSVFFFFKGISKSTFHKMAGFGSLNFVNTIAATVAFQGPVLIIGKFLGEEAVTAFAPALLISQSLQGLLGRISAPLVPLASRDIETNNGAGLGQWAIKIGQVAGIIGFSVTIPFCVFGNEITGLWLGKDLSWTWSVIAVMSTGVAISQIQGVNYYLALGGGNIKPTVISQVAMAVIVFAGTIVGTAYWNWGIFNVAMFIGVCIFLRNTLYLAYAYSKQFSYPFFTYQWKVYVQPAIAALLCIAIGYVLKLAFQPDNIFLLGIYIVIVVGIFAVLSWIFILPEEIKKLLPLNRIMKILKLN